MSASAADFRACRRVIATHSRSFSLASRLFPGERRDEVAAVYAWCRRCDDRIDLSPPERHAEELAALRAELRSVYAGEPQPDAVGRCFQAVTRRHRIPEPYPAELLEGMAMDALGHRYESLEELLLYCHRVAGCVGLLLCHVMGVSRPDAVRHAAHLGIAMQLTNVCRDVLEDAGRGRAYVPEELVGAELAEALRGGLARAPDAAQRATLAGAVRTLLTLAERFYASGDTGLAFLEPRSALAVRTARLVYAEIGRVIESRDCDVLRGRAVVSGPRKLVLLGRALAAFAVAGRRGPRLRVAAPDRLLQPAEAVTLD